jgi:hypothetical protein
LPEARRVNVAIDTSILAEAYAGEIHRQSRLYHGNWLPSSERKLGDFGEVHDDLFAYEGNIADFGVEFATRIDQTRSYHHYTSKDSVSVTALGAVKGDQGSIKLSAGIHVGMSAEGAVFLNAAGCTEKSIENLGDLTAPLLKLLRSKKWRGSLAIVTCIVESDSATIIVSEGKSLTIDLRAKARTAKVDLASGSLQFGVAKSQGASWNILTQKAYPLMKLAKLQPARWIWDDKIVKPYAARMELERLSEISSALADQSVEYLLPYVTESDSKEAFEIAEIA